MPRQNVRKYDLWLNEALEVVGKLGARYDIRTMYDLIDTRNGTHTLNLLGPLSKIELHYRKNENNTKSVERAIVETRELEKEWKNCQLIFEKHYDEMIKLGLKDIGIESPKYRLTMDFTERNEDNPDPEIAFRNGIGRLYNLVTRMEEYYEDVLDLLKIHK